MVDQPRKTAFPLEGRHDRTVITFEHVKGTELEELFNLKLSPEAQREIDAIEEWQRESLVRVRNIVVGFVS